MMLKFLIAPFFICLKTAEPLKRDSSLLTTKFPRVTGTDYIMTTRGAKGSHSAPNIPQKSTTHVDFFKTSTQPSKRPQEDLENTPTITINSQGTNNTEQ